MSILTPRDLYAHFDVTVRTVSVGTTSTEVAPFDADRVVLLMNVAGAAQVFLMPIQAAVVNQGIPISSTTEPQRFSHRNDGPLTQVQWNGIINFGIGDVTVIEAFIRRDPSRPRRQPEQG